MLKILLLGENQISTMDPDVFAGLNSLEFLYLHHNQISSFDSQIFAGLHSLKELDRKQ